MYQLNITFGPSFKFHSNLSFKKSSLKKLLPFYKDMLICWCQSLSGSPENSSLMLYQFLRFNKYIKIEGTVMHFPKFSSKGINFLSQLLGNGRIISWISLKDRYELSKDMFFQWAQLKHAIPPRWKKNFLITVTLKRTTYAKIIMLSQELEFFLLAAIDTTLRSFQYKILNNVLFLNKKLCFLE